MGVTGALKVIAAKVGEVGYETTTNDTDSPGFN
jgi:hypothetical protein